MKTLAYAALPASLLLALAGCDSPGEQQMEAEREAVEVGADGQQTRDLEEQARALRSGDLEAREDAVQAEQDRVDDVADGE